MHAENCHSWQLAAWELEPDLAKKILDTDAEMAAAAVGYATRLTQRLAALLDVPLRYPLRFANSRSSIYSHGPSGRQHQVTADISFCS